MTKGDVEVYFTDFSLEWMGKVRFTTDPELFYGNGTGLFYLNKLNSTTVLNFDRGANKLPSILLKKSKVDISNKSVSMHFEGTNDVFQLLDMAKNFSLPMILDLISGEMKGETLKLIQDSINGALESLPHEFVIPGTNIAFDYGFLYSPKVSKDGYVPFPIAGSARCVNETTCGHFEPKPIPPKVDDFENGKGSFQLHISDYILNSVLVAAFDDHLLHYKVTPEFVHSLTEGAIELDTDLFGVFIPEIRRRYGPKRPITLQINANTPPEFIISKKSMDSKKLI